MKDSRVMDNEPRVQQHGLQWPHVSSVSIPEFLHVELTRIQPESFKLTYLCTGAQPTFDLPALSIYVKCIPYTPISTHEQAYPHDGLMGLTDS